MDDESGIKGVITIKRLDQLEAQGHKVVIVGPSPFLDKQFTDERYWVKDFESNDERWLAVKKTIERHSFNSNNTIYIDDSEDLRNQVKVTLKKVLNREPVSDNEYQLIFDVLSISQKKKLKIADLEIGCNLPG